jgi:membrane protein CcdC involved in cytochrome C biogenesis
MKMQQDVKLNPKEQKLGWILLALFLFLMILIIVGITSQSRGVNYDYLLTPLFFFSGGLFFFFFGFNGLAKKQLVEKWAPYIFSAWIKLIARLFVTRANDKERDAWKITLGIVALIIGLICWITAFYDLYKRF